MRDGLTLSHGALRAVVLPGQGGSLAAFWWQGDTRLDVLRPATADAGPTDMASFPLAPFSNCVAGGRFTWRGQRVSLPTFGPEEPDHALHGFAWTAPMQVVTNALDSVTLVQHERRVGTPFDYTLEQCYCLGPHGLETRLSLTNTGRAAMPCGLGFHPYFCITPGTRLKTGPLQMWLNGPDRLPSAPVDADPSVTEGTRAIDGLDIDNCHEGWQGTALLIRPDAPFAVTFTSDLGWLVVYRPQGAPWICVEPVSHLTDALNREDPAAFGMRSLAPGETMTAWMRIGIVTPPDDADGFSTG